MAAAHLCLQSEPQMLSASPGGSLRSSSGSDPSSFQNLASTLGPRACEFCVHNFGMNSLFPRTPGPLKISPTGLQSQTVWGLVFPVQDAGLGVLTWGSDSLLLGKTSAIVIIFPFWITHPGLRFLTVSCHYSSPPVYIDVVPSVYL